MVEIFTDFESDMIKVVVNGGVLKEDFRTNFDISNTINGHAFDPFAGLNAG